jgi:hypothetical protein
MTRWTRIALVFLLVAALATTAVPAAPLSGAGPGADRIVVSTPLDLLARAWDFLASLWSKNGCQVDPSGLCLPDQGSGTTKNGCGADPNGYCR